MRKKVAAAAEKGPQALEGSLAAYVGLARFGWCFVSFCSQHDTMLAITAVRPST